MVLVDSWRFLYVFILGNILQENVFYDILEGKNASLGYKNKKFQSQKIEIFCKGVRLWFMYKIDHFCMFFYFW